MGTILL